MKRVLSIPHKRVLAISFNKSAILFNQPQQFKQNIFTHILLNNTKNKLAENLNTILSKNYCKENIKSCWKCQNNSTNKVPFFCDLCGIIQDPNKCLNFFKLLSIEERFKIDSTKLSNQFRQLQNLVHPDKYSKKSEREQLNSQEWSSLINKAYKTLQTPIERGEYLLKTKGVQIPKDNSSLNKEFLMEMMERNEEVEDSSSKDLDELHNRVKNDMLEEIKKLDKEFEENNIEKIILILVKMRYFRSLEQSIKDKIEKLLVAC